MRRSKQAYHELLRLIRSGELPSGAAVTEQDLVERLGVSRTPIREALARLTQYGVVTRRPGSSVVIQPMDLSRYVQLAEVRGVLESYAARLFVRNATEADMAILEQLARAADESDAASDEDQVVAAETEFHSFLAKRSGNTELANILETTSLLTTCAALAVGGQLLERGAGLDRFLVLIGIGCIFGIAGALVMIPVPGGGAMPGGGLRRRQLAHCVLDRFPWLGLKAI